MGWLGPGGLLLLAMLAGVGVGGGGLLVLWLTLVEGLPQGEAQGENLLFFLAASGAALLVNCRKRRFDKTALLFTVLGGLPAAVGGALLASVVDVGLLRRCFGGLLILSGLLTLRKKPETTKDPKR